MARAVLMVRYAWINALTPVVMGEASFIFRLRRKDRAVRMGYLRRDALQFLEMGRDGQ